MSDPKQALRQALRDIADKFAVDVTSQPLVPGQDYLPCCGKLVGAGEFGALLEASADMWLTAGRFADEFEATFPTVWGMKRSLLVNSGSSANLVSLAALMSPKLRERALEPGDEFITTACAFPTTVAPAIQYGLKPIFIDVHETTHNATPEMIEAAITPKTRLVMIAHSLGNPFRADRVAEICTRHGIWLVEDCCDALGATIGYQGSIGLAIRAERVDAAAAASMRASGLVHAGFYAELSMAKVDGFGSDVKLSVGDTTWFAGVDFEF